MILPENINTAGAITGYFADASNLYHGFLRATSGTITTFDAPGVGTAAYEGTFPESNDAAGDITGLYIDANYVAHSFVLTAPAATTTTLTSSPNPSAYGQAALLSATVTSKAGALDGGTVSFIKGTTVLGTGTLAGGSASFTTSTLNVGSNVIKAVYGGDSDFAGSTSGTVKQVVNKAATTTLLNCAPSPSTFGEAVTCTASVTAQFSGIPTGKMTLYDGATALKTVAPSGGTAKFTTSTLTAGTHTITATYTGSTSFDGSSGSQTQIVKQGPAEPL